MSLRNLTALRLAGLERGTVVTAVALVAVIVVRNPVQVLGRDAGIAYVVWPLAPVAAVVAVASSATEWPTELLLSRWQIFRRLRAASLLLCACATAVVALGAGVSCHLSGCSRAVTVSAVVTRNGLLATGSCLLLARQGRPGWLAAPALWALASWLWGVNATAAPLSWWAVWLNVEAGSTGDLAAWAMGAVGVTAYLWHGPLAAME